MNESLIVTNTSYSDQQKRLCLSGGYYFKQRSFDEEVKNKLESIGVFKISDLNNCHVTLDWSSTYWFDLGALLWVIVFLHQIKAQDCKILIKLPDPIDTKSFAVWNFLKYWKFFETLDACVDHPSNLLLSSQIPYVKEIPSYSYSYRFDENGNIQQLFTGNVLEIKYFRKPISQENSSSINDYLESWESKIIKLAVRNLCGFQKDEADFFVTGVIREGLSNSFLHANGTLLLISTVVDNKNFTVSISDNGIGIPDSLRSVRIGNKNWDDWELITYFTEPDMIINEPDSKLIELATIKGITSQLARPGDGLFYLKDFVTNKSGELRIRSGTARVDFTKGNKEFRENLIQSRGTSLRIQIPKINK